MPKHGPYTTGDVAKILKVSAYTVNRLIEGGHLKAYKFPPGRMRRVTHSDMVAFLDGHNYPLHWIEKFNAAS